MFDFDSVSDLIRQPCNAYDNQAHLKVQSGKIRILNAYLIAETFQARGYPVTWSSISRFQVLGRKPTISFMNAYIRGRGKKSANELLRYKDKFKKSLVANGIQVSPGKTFSSDEVDRARKHVEKSKSSLVIKPTSGSKGRGVSVGINGLEHFDTAWKEALKANRREDRVLIEEQFIGGSEVRFLVVAGHCVSAYRRIPPIVVGDGSTTVEQLIKEKNEIKRRNPHQYTRTIKIDEHRKNVLAHQSLTLDSIPAEDALVLIDYKASASTGADTVEVSDDISPEFMRLAEKVSLAAGGVPILGIDILAHDFNPPHSRGF
jgi:D-alanine-D-alanine ligase-like ATP-grasp enzyme